MNTVQLLLLLLVAGALSYLYARRKHLEAFVWLAVYSVTVGTFWVLIAAWTAQQAPEPGMSALAVPTQDVSKLPGFAPPVLTPAPANLDPNSLLAKSDAAMNQLHSLSEVQHLVGSSGTGMTATFAYQAPDRLRYQTSAGLQSIAIDDTQYYQDEGKAWTKTQRAIPLRWPNFTYAKDAAEAKLEGLEVVDGELCAVISFNAPNVDLFRNWVGLTTGLLRKQQMFAPGHNMLTSFAQHNGPLQIAAP